MDQLIVIVLYETQTGTTDALFESIAASECKQIDIRLSTVGATHRTATLVLSGSWNQLTRFKARFALLKEHYPISALVQDVKATTYTTESLPYEVYVAMPAQPHTLHHAIRFFLSLPIDLHSLSVSTYQAPITQTTMIELNMVFITTAGRSVNDYREHILQFCDENHLEVVLESKRN